MTIVRKRNRYTRGRAKRSRPKTPAPKTGWLIGELAELSAIPIRTIRYYVEQRLLRPTEFRGTATRYERRELLRLLATMRARRETRLKLSEIRKRLDTLGDSELESWLRQQPLPPAAAALLAATSPHTSSSAPMQITTPTPNESDAPLAAPLLESWQRICLAPGLDLMVRADVSPAVRAAALRICADHLAR
jgi:DNA-binding transcriptional MerR regulator